MRSRKLLEFVLINSTFTFEWTKLFIWRVLGKTSKVNLLNKFEKFSREWISHWVSNWFFNPHLVTIQFSNDESLELKSRCGSTTTLKGSSHQSEVIPRVNCQQSWLLAPKTLLGQYDVQHQKLENFGHFWAFPQVCGVTKFRRKGGGPPNSRKFTKWFSKCTCFESLIRKWENPK